MLWPFLPSKIFSLPGKLLTLRFSASRPLVLGRLVFFDVIRSGRIKVVMLVGKPQSIAIQYIKPTVSY